MLLLTLDLCLFHFVYIPVELRQIVRRFSFEEITNDNIRNATLVTIRDGNLRHGPMEYWDTSKVTNMSSVFSSSEHTYYHDFNTDISRWDVSNVTKMRAMFCDARKFNQPIGNWDVSNVKDMSGMFLFAAKTCVLIYGNRTTQLKSVRLVIGTNLV